MWLYISAGRSTSTQLEIHLHIQCDIIRVIQPVWISLWLSYLSLSLSSCPGTVFIYSPQHSPDIFCSAGLFSLSLSFLPAIFPFVADCSPNRKALGFSLNCHNSILLFTETQDARRKKQRLLSSLLCCCSFNICCILWHILFPFTLIPEDKYKLLVLTWYQCCHFSSLLFKALLKVHATNEHEQMWPLKML